MPNYTDNYNLIKPKKEENYDVNETTNNNMDIIDSELYKRVQKVPGKGLSSNDFTNEYIKKINQMGEAKRGFTFTPSVSEEGIISWTNDGELDNPNPVNIKGPQGAIGPHLWVTLLQSQKIKVYIFDKTLQTKGLQKINNLSQNKKMTKIRAKIG